MNRHLLPLRIMVHPVTGFDDLRYRKTASIRASLVIFLLFGFADIVKAQFQGKQFSMADRNDVDIFLILGSRLALLLLFVVSNWAFCVLMEGKARIVEIWIITLYSLLPYVLCRYLSIGLSLVMAREEGVFLALLEVFGALWSLLLILFAFMEFHEFEMSKVIASLFLTLFGMLLLVLLAFLCYSLFKQVFDTLVTIFNEILFRIREGGGNR